MCGITGFCDFEKKSSDEILTKMTNSLIHRGPDDFGIKSLNLKTAQIGLGIRRLSILDLSSSGHQPMEFEYLTIVFNGEIYNFQEIKDDLIKEGYRFASNSDTEVILLGYHFWGPGIVQKLIGMFAFVICDTFNNELFIVRDRTGIKPLYYYQHGSLLLWSSELRSFHSHPAFKKQIDNNSLALYMQYGYVPVPYCIFKHVRKVEPGSYIKIKLSDRSFTSEKYWDVIDHYNLGPIDLPENEIIDETERILQSAYAFRMISDVPVGIFLSGGYDSASVAAILQTGAHKRIDTFTAGFNEADFNEAPHAKKIAEFLGTNHHEMYVTSQDAFELLPSLAEVYDEPFADNSIIPTLLVSKLASGKVKVVLSADGGDEIFAGYKKYFTAIEKAGSPWLLKQSEFAHNEAFNDPEELFDLKATNRLKKPLFNERTADVILALKRHSQQFTDSEIKTIFKNNVLNLPTTFDLYDQNSLKTDELNGLLAIDYKTFLLDNNLVKVDRATMSFGIECREPMLDHRLIEFVSRIPASLKVKNGDKKYILKQIVHKYLSKELMDRPKMPFIAPLSNWLQTELKSFLMEYINKEKLTATRLFNVEFILKVRDRFFEGKENYQRIWNLLIFMLWYERWIDNQNS
jgi:asparagine synthase (glutamine-hydrolysing)